MTLDRFRQAQPGRSPIVRMVTCILEIVLIRKNQSRLGVQMRGYRADLDGGPVRGRQLG